MHANDASAADDRQLCKKGGARGNAQFNTFQKRFSSSINYEEALMRLHDRRLDEIKMVLPLRSAKGNSYSFEFYFKWSFG